MCITRVESVRPPLHPRHSQALMLELSSRKEIAMWMTTAMTITVAMSTVTVLLIAMEMTTMMMMMMVMVSVRLSHRTTRRIVGALEAVAAGE